MDNMQFLWVLTPTALKHQINIMAMLIFEYWWYTDET